MTWGMVAVAGGTVASGLIGADAARGAAATQAEAAKKAARINRKIYLQQREDLRPYREQGYTALEDIEALKPFLTGQFGPEEFETYLDPSIAFRQRLGTQATERLANIGGGALSGNTMRALEEFGQGLASTEYGNAFNRFQTERSNIYNTLANIAGMGQNAVNTGVSAGQALGSQLTGLTTGAGAAQAAGQVGAANAIGGAVQGLGNMYYLNQLMRPPTSAAVTNYGLSAGMPAATPGMGGGTGLTYSPNMANQFFSAR
jgi:hypothetical protein